MSFPVAPYSLVGGGGAEQFQVTRLEVQRRQVGYPAPRPSHGVREQGSVELAVGLGLDYLRSRDLALGGFARYHLAATSTGRLPAMVTAGLRVVLRWE